MSNKVRKIKAGENNVVREGGSGDSHHSDHGFSDAAFSDHREDATSSGASTPRGDVAPSPFGIFSQATADEKSPGKNLRDSGDENEGKPGIHRVITSKAEAWIGKKVMSWPWKGNEREGSEVKTNRFGWPWLQNDHENDMVQPKNPNFGAKTENLVGESNRHGNNDASGSWSSFNVNSMSSVSSCGSTSSSAVNKVDMETDCLDYEILWEDLTIGEQIGQGNHLSSEYDMHVYYCLVSETIIFFHGSVKAWVEWMKLYKWNMKPFSYIFPKLGIPRHVNEVNKGIWPTNPVIDLMNSFAIDCKLIHWCWGRFLFVSLFL